jgi:hypothetical protein
MRRGSHSLTVREPRPAYRSRPSTVVLRVSLLIAQGRLNVKRECCKGVLQVSERNRSSPQSVFVGLHPLLGFLKNVPPTDFIVEKREPPFGLLLGHSV